LVREFESVKFHEGSHLYGCGRRGILAYCDGGCGAARDVAFSM
jgi:hypothetical protein